MNIASAPVLILGAGINGAAIARELLLNGVPVIMVDRADLASGASAYNSRLIHGGLRYLEYGEFDLVRESLAERDRLLEHASHLVKPLRLYIPCENRWGGTFAAGKRFVGVKAGVSNTSRGWWLARVGLAMYDAYTGRGPLPRSRSCKVGTSATPPVDRTRYRWFCSYYDAQVQYPERLVLSLLADARQLAAEQGLGFRLLTYHCVRRIGERFEIVPSDHQPATTASCITLAPAAVINATGASVDDSLRQIEIDSRRLIGGTKGSHLLTRQTALREALGCDAIYAEAADGRPVFLLPFGESVLVGTTDIPFEGDPAAAVASAKEIEYLIAAVNRVFPQVKLHETDIDQHYCGVRPLPHVDAASTSAITRRHWLHRHESVSPPLYSVIGGKLTTCRQLAEDVVREIAPALGRTVIANSRERALPGNPAADEAASQWGERRRIASEQAERIWQLCGSRAEALTLDDVRNSNSHPAQPFPPGFVRGVIEQEQPRHLTDLVERRLMLVYDPHLSRGTLGWLAGLLADAGVIGHDAIDAEVDSCIERLEKSFGKQVLP